MATFVRWALAFLTAALAFVGAAAGQIIELRTVGNMPITCMRTGLSNEDCGLRSDWYAYVFVGSVSSVRAVEGDESELQITPEEVFYGEPANPLMVKTSQGKCFPELKVGDEWLFFLRKNEPLLLDYYGNISRPVTDAQEQLEILRRLEKIGDKGILRGKVRKGPFGQGEPVPNAYVLAHRISDNVQFLAISDGDGQYQFQPLSVGKYKISVDPIGSIELDESTVDIRSNSCRDLTLSRSPHAQISGRLRHPDGSAVPQVRVLIISSGESWFSTAVTDPHGYFRFDMLEPGSYVIGINQPGAPEWKLGGCSGDCKDKIPSAFLYYPGVSNRAGAMPVTLATDERRDNVDFAVPSQ